MPSADCDLDHREQWVDGGPTTEDNLAPLCRHDHIVKHSGWTLARLPNGDHQWSSRLGHTYPNRRKTSVRPRRSHMLKTNGPPFAGFVPPAVGAVTTRYMVNLT